MHKSELHRLADLVKYNISFKCRQCNSFAQWGIDNIGEDFLERYWDYDKNKISPWDVECKLSKYKVWIKCQKKDYHGSYDIIPLSFVAGNRCRYCVNYNGEVHKLDSLGMVFPKILSVWSDKNKKSPYEYSPTSGKSVWWKCHEGKHSDYYRKISRSKTCGFCCPECQNSKGEDKISQYLINNNFIRIKQEDFDKISDIEKYKNKYYITQKIYNGLMGVGNGYLRYDFYLPQYNLLIEYQGQQHEKFIKGIYSSKKDFEIQQEHDRRKREYAQNNNIKLLEIWYWDYDKIESILEKEIVNSLLK